MRSIYIHMFFITACVIVKNYIRAFWNVVLDDDTENEL